MATYLSKLMARRIPDSVQEKKVYEEHLGQAGIKDDLWNMKTHRSQHRGQSRKGHSQVIDRQKEQEVVHWLVQALFLLYDEENEDIAYNGDSIEQQQEAT